MRWVHPSGWSVNRSWLDCGEKSTNQLRVVSYNVLCDGYATKPGRIQRYVNELTTATEETMAWRNRFPKLLDELITYDADIVALQVTFGFWARV